MAEILSFTGEGALTIQCSKREDLGWWDKLIFACPAPRYRSIRVSKCRQDFGTNFSVGLTFHAAPDTLGNYYATFARIPGCDDRCPGPVSGVRDYNTSFQFDGISFA